MTTSGETKRFLSAVFDGADGLFELLAISKDEEQPVSRLFTDDLDELCAEIDRVKDDANFYFGVTKKRDKAGTKESAYKICCFWADLDFKDFAGGEAEARERIHVFRFKPSIIINTGGGLHCYWLFKKPMSAIF